MSLNVFLFWPTLQLCTISKSGRGVAKVFFEVILLGKVLGDDIGGSLCVN